MKILMVNKFHYLKGGSEKYYFELAELLRKNGHEVAFFSMQNEKNIKTDSKEYFVESIDLNNGSKLSALDVIYSKKNKQKMKEALEDFKPDIVHLNNFQRQLSASIIEPIKEKNIPIVFTAHDVQAICPAIVMLDSNKNICEKCMKGKYINCTKSKCIKESMLKSVLGTIEAQYYRYKKIYKDKIDFIITPSEFYREKLIEDGISKEKIEAIHNFINIEEYNIEKKDEGYGLYFGRLSKEKGILNLMEAIKNLKDGVLYIAGEGPEKENIIKFINENKLQERVRLLGFLDSCKIKKYVANSRFVVVPSIWYENCPYSILETLAIGKPIIGSKIAGIPELIDDNMSGLLYEYNNVEELTEKMNILYENQSLANQLGENAKKIAQQKYSKEKYYNKINDIYNKVLDGGLKNE